MNESDAAMASTIEFGDPDAPDVVELLRCSAAEAASLYGAACHTLSAKQLVSPSVRFLVARAESGGDAVGCGALLILDTYAEVKRMFVAPHARRRGIGADILRALERVARDEGVSRLLLETGQKQPAAVALYRRFGYLDRGVFGDYGDNPLSIYMEKELDRPATGAATAPPLPSHRHVR